MALDRPEWLAELSRAFKRQRQGRSGWFVELHGERLRVLSAELPLRPDEPAEAPAKRRSFPLSTPPDRAAGTGPAGRPWPSVDAATPPTPGPGARGDGVEPGADRG